MIDKLKNNLFYTVAAVLFGWTLLISLPLLLALHPKDRETDRIADVNMIKAMASKSERLRIFMDTNSCTTKDYKPLPGRAGTYSEVLCGSHMVILINEEHLYVYEYGELIAIDYTTKLK